MPGVPRASVAAHGRAAHPHGMRTELRRRRDGLVQIARVGRWRWVGWALCGLLVVPPLLLALVFAMPPVLLALPPMALYVAIWAVMRRLDAPAPPPAAPRARPGDVLPLRRYDRG